MFRTSPSETFINNRLRISGYSWPGSADAYDLLHEKRTLSIVAPAKIVDSHNGDRWKSAAKIESRDYSTTHKAGGKSVWPSPIIVDSPINVSPPGMITAFAGKTAPIGWLMCDGSKKSVGDYPYLADVLGDTYGAKTETEFTLPDLRGRVIAGYGNDAVLSSSTTLGHTRGSENWKLTIDEMPSHTHSYTTHSALGASGFGGDAQLRSKSATTGTSGGNKAHNNVQPTIVLNYIIKAN